MPKPKIIKDYLGPESFIFLGQPNMKARSSENDKLGRRVQGLEKAPAES
jgi:hypothetical protein